jgi:hypothetical protein
MSKKAYLISIGCFIVGLLLGVGGTYFFVMAHWGRVTADGLALLKEGEIAESGQEAFAAYRHESKPVAVYALTQYLETLKQGEEIGSGNPVFMSKTGINNYLMLTHGRLAKIYTELGQSDLSAQHVAEALRCASQDQHLRGITNQATLTAILARVDQREEN